jgi:hypothetical protein
MNTYEIGTKVQTVTAGGQLLTGTVVKVRKTVQVDWEQLGYPTWEKVSDLEPVK